MCEDHGDEGHLYPAADAGFERLVEISEGCQSIAGSRILQRAEAATVVPGSRGCEPPKVHLMQLAFLRAEEKLFWAVTLREAAPAIFAVRASTPEELESICAEMLTIAADESTLLMLARVTQVGGRKYPPAALDAPKACPTSTLREHT